jgi:hypothetical protein
VNSYEEEIAGHIPNTGNPTWKWLNFILIYVFETGYIAVAERS